MILDSCDIPIVLAPLAGGPSTPELAAAVSNAGGLGFLASGYLSAAELEARSRRTGELTGRPFGVNLFTPGPGADVIAGLRGRGTEVWVTVTSLDEARRAAAAGADLLVVQGYEAGGHRGG